MHATDALLIVIGANDGLGKGAAEQHDERDGVDRGERRLAAFLRTRINLLGV